MSQLPAKKRKPKSSEELHRQTPSKKQRKESVEAQDESHASDPATLVADEDIFTLECPARKARKNGKKNAGLDDVFGPMQEDGGFPELKIDYSIRPGKDWTDLKTFRFFKIQGEIFSTGSLVHINRRMPPPDPPDAQASDGEILAFDKENYWVGRVLEVKAASTAEVWLRVFWLYWPEELPRGRQEYHGNQELIMSNHMAIVDAKSVASMADINHWDEEDQDQTVGYRFWRQFFDVEKQDTKGGGMSSIRRYCICNEYHNPDQTMFKCPNSNCGIWIHQKCMEEAIVEKRNTEAVADEKSVEAKTKHVPDSKLAQPRPEEEIRPENEVDHKPLGQAANCQSVTKPLNNQPTGGDGVFNAEMSVDETGADGTSVIITGGMAQNLEMWPEGDHCLRCGTVID